MTSFDFANYKTIEKNVVKSNKVWLPKLFFDKILKTQL